MNDSVDWKKKHLDALREMEREERRWRGIEQILRRLVGRLCTAANGIDPRLDAQLDKLAAAARRDADEVELKALFDSLKDAVLAIEKAPTETLPAVRGERAETAAPAPPTPDRFDRTVRMPAAGRAGANDALGAGATRGGGTPARVPAHTPARPIRWDASCTALATLLDRLTPADPLGSDVPGLRADVVAAATDLELAAVIARIAEVVGERSAEIARERAEAAAMLAQVTERLEEMAQYIASASEDRSATRDATETLNIEVLSQMTELTRDLDGTNDLPSLRARVASRLEGVATQVREFRAREQQRYDAEAVRSERMRARIGELELQTRELHRSLDLEKRRARFDPLTRVANRTSFDERFAEELARWQRFRAPVSVALWDVDNFKAVNDTYGHRAGDAVLREVAATLAGRRRATDFIARYGGEEFAMLFVGTPLADAIAVAQDLRERVAALGFHVRGTPVKVTVSCGLTELREGDTAPRVFDRADRALYRAKDGGRNLCIAA